MIAAQGLFHDSYGFREAGFCFVEPGVVVEFDSSGAKAKNPVTFLITETLGNEVVSVSSLDIGRFEVVLEAECFALLVICPPGWA